MNTIKILNKQTMSSREIAHVTNKQHRNVLADCENLNAEYRKMTLAEISAGVYYHPKTGKQEHREYHLTKIQTLDLITGYDIQMRIKVNRRWEQLEKQLNNPFIELQPKTFESGELFYPYKSALECAGCSTRSGSFYKRMRRYPNEFRYDKSGIAFASLALCISIKKNRDLLQERKVISERNPRYIDARQLMLFDSNQKLSLLNEVVKIPDHDLRTRIAGKIMGD